VKNKLAACLAVFVLTLLVIPAAVRGQEVSHFKRVDIPLNERRVSELGRVWEFRCEYELAKFTQGALLVAELYRDGKCAGRFHLSRIKFDESRQTRSGTLSLGWQRDTHNLISVIDNGVSVWPSTSVHLEAFEPLDACYFTDSPPEKRKAGRRGGMDCELYPVMGLCGQRSLKIKYPEKPDAGSFLKACREAGAKTAVIIYLYPSPMDEDPGLGFADGR